MIGKQLLSNSVEPDFFSFNTFLANSIIANCIPKHIPKKGILFILAYFIHRIFPSVPLLPNPPGINIPDRFLKILLKLFFFILSDSILTILTWTLFTNPPWTSASSIDLYASLNFTYLPIRPIFIVLFFFKIELEIFFHCIRSIFFFALKLKCFNTWASNFSLWKLIGASYIVFTSIVWITLLILTLQNSAIFFLCRIGISYSHRQMIISGWIPIALNSLTECCVGLVFISPDDLINGTNVRWTKSAFCFPTSFENCLMASKNGKLSISPTVPPISQITKSSFTSFLIKFLILSVTWGITWTVLPR